jgi:hypothetical protein
MSTALHLDPEETILIEVRKHWFVFFSYGLFLFVASIAPPIFYELIINFIKIDVPILGNFSSLTLFAYMLWLLILWMGFFIQWTNYYLDVWYVTEKRIIDINQQSMFHREISSLRLDKIQDLSINVRGFLATFLNFGDIHVQTAAEDSDDFLMTNVSNPENIRQVIFSHHNKEAEKAHPLNNKTQDVSKG